MKENSFCSMLRYFDFFGVNINLRIQNQEKYQTVSGAISSILFFILAFFYCTIYFITFVTRNQMNLIFNQKYVSPPPQINFTNQKFNLAISTLYDANNTVVSNLTAHYITEKIYLVKITNSTKKEKVPLKLRACNESDFYGIWTKEKLEAMQMDQKRCLDNNNMTLQGSFNDEIYQYIEYGIYLDTNFFKNVKTTVEFSDKMKYLYEFFTSNIIKTVVNNIDANLDSDKYENPVSYQLNSFIALLDVSVIQKINLDYSTLSFSNDDNILLENYNSQASIKFDQYLSYQSVLYDKTHLSDEYKYTILKLYFRSSPKFTQIKRQYQKIQDYMANMTGLLGQILFIFYIIFSYINMFELERSIMNKIFKYKDHMKFKQSPEMKKIKLKVFNSKIFKISNYDNDINNVNYSSEDISKHSNENGNANVNVNGNLNLGSPAEFGEMIIKKNSIIAEDNTNTVNIYSFDKTIKLKSKQSVIVNPTVNSVLKRKATARSILDNRLLKHLNSKSFLHLNANQNNEKEQLKLQRKTVIVNRVTEEEENEHKENKELQLDDNEENHALDNNEKISELNNISNNINKDKVINPKKVSLFSGSENPNENLISPNPNDNLTPNYNINDNSNSIAKDDDVKNVLNSKDPVSLNVLEKIFICSCCNRKRLNMKKYLYEKSLTKLHFYLDIHTFIKKMQEIDILKYLFLSNEQLVLFNFLSKPSVAINNNKNEKLLHNEIAQTDLVGYEMKDEELNNIAHYYEALTKDGEEDNETNRKIVTLFNNEINYIFN